MSESKWREALAEVLEREYGCKRGMVYEGYGAECASHAHAPALYRTFGCDHVAHIAEVLAPVVAQMLADAKAEAWDGGYIHGHQQACPGPCTHGLARNPHSAHCAEHGLRVQDHVRDFGCTYPAAEASGQEPT